MESKRATKRAAAKKSCDVPAKKKATPTTHPTEDIRLELGNNRFLTCGEFEGNPKIHIRQYDDKDGYLIPTKVGICMSPHRFAAFRFHMEAIDESVSGLRARRFVDTKLHIGGGYYAAVNTGHFCVNLRKYFYSPGKTEEVPTRFGIALRLHEWETLKARVAELLVLKPEFENAMRCADTPDHNNLLIYTNCGECNHLPPDHLPW